jgi:hypothetical protein
MACWRSLGLEPPRASHPSKLRDYESRKLGAYPEAPPRSRTPHWPHRKVTDQFS